MADVFLPLLGVLAKTNPIFKYVVDIQAHNDGWGHGLSFDSDADRFTSNDDYGEMRKKYGHIYLKDPLFVAWCWLADGEWALRHGENSIYNGLCEGTKPQKKAIQQLIDMAYDRDFPKPEKTTK